MFKSIEFFYQPTTFRKYYQWLLLAVIALLSFATFLELGEDVWFREKFAWDTSFILTIHAYSRPWLDSLMSAITETAGTYAVLGVLGLAAWLWWRNSRLNALTIVLSFAGSVVFNSVLKILFARPRPTIIPQLVAESGYSFPSGHTIGAVALYGLLAIWLWQQRRWLLALLCTLWPMIVAVSRVYLGVHYPSDVLASLTVGILWVITIETTRKWLATQTFLPAVLRS